MCPCLRVRGACACVCVCAGVWCGSHWEGLTHHEGTPSVIRMNQSMSPEAWARTEQLAKQDGLGDAEMFALAVGCPTHGNASMDWDEDGVFCHKCQ